MDQVLRDISFSPRRRAGPGGGAGWPDAGVEPGAAGGGVPWSVVGGAAGMGAVARQGRGRGPRPRAPVSLSKTLV
jgi:hypothetical protein